MRKVYKGQSILQAMDNLSQLVDRIQRSAGYEVFCHAIGRRDLNDFGDDRSYIRAVHNIRNPVARVSSPLRDDIVRDVSSKAGIPKPKIYIISDSHANAFATGRNPENASIGVTQGLLDTINLLLHFIC